MGQARSRVRFLGHSTVLLDLPGSRVLTDPLLTDRLGLLHRHAGDVRDAFGDAPIDVVVVSHGHHDHLHMASLRALPGKPQIVVPRGLGSLLTGLGRDVVEVTAGDVVSVGGPRIAALTARHHVRRRPFGPETPALGYLVDAVGSPRIYFAGDTDLFPEMADLAGQVDVALIPVWGWGPRLGSGHLDPRRAAEAVGLIRPRVAIPIHWGTFYPIAFARIWPRPLADPPQDFAREVERIAPQTEVRVLTPGQELVV